MAAAGEMQSGRGNSGSRGSKRRLAGMLLMARCAHGLQMAPSAAPHGAYRSTPRAAAAVMQVEAPERSVSVSEMSSQMREMREKMETDEDTRLYMQALRGTNLNDDATAAASTKLQVVEVSSGKGDDVLPTTYQPERLESYFNKRPGAVLTRIFQIASTSAGWLAGVAAKALTGELKPGSAAEVEQVAKLREIIVSLGPFFIKLGQALSIRPDILSPQAMVEMQQLCDKVPAFDSKMAMGTIEDELGRPVDAVFSAITPEPVAAASLGQVYKATLRDSGDEVAVKVQRPFVLETVSLDLYLVRKLGVALKAAGLAEKVDLVSLLDEFASRFYQELDYDIECANGERVRAEMAKLERVVIPKNYPEFTARRVHVAEWVDGEKLSQSKADDVSELVNLGVIAYLTQLLETGFFHADPHPGNMMRTPDGSRPVLSGSGKLVILDFGLMTEVTDDQKYGMIEAIAHLIHRDYARIGDDFVSLDFIPQGTDTAPIVPALARVFDAALAGGAACRRGRLRGGRVRRPQLLGSVPPTALPRLRRASAPPSSGCAAAARPGSPAPRSHALIATQAAAPSRSTSRSSRPTWRRSPSSSPSASRPTSRSSSAPSRCSRASRSSATRAPAGQFAIVDEAYPYISRRLLTDETPRLRAALRYMVYGQGESFDVDRMIDMLQALEKFVDVKDNGDGSAFKVDGVRNGVDLGNAGSMTGTRALASQPQPAAGGGVAPASGSPLGDGEEAGARAAKVRVALDFFFSADGAVFRGFLLDEVVRAVDSLSREALGELALSVGVRGQQLPGVLRALAPPLTEADRKVVASIRKLVEFFLGDTALPGTPGGAPAASAESLRQLQALLPVLNENRAQMRAFGLQIVGRLAEKQTERALGWVRVQVRGDEQRPAAA